MKPTRTVQPKQTGFFQNIGPWYMLRLRFFPFWLSDKLGFNIFIHLFLKSDNDVVHDHPWASYSVLLWGNIHERRQVKMDEYGGANFVREFETDSIDKFKRVYRTAKYRHAIVLNSKWALTVFIPLKKERTWYFYPEGKPVHWKNFLDTVQPIENVKDWPSRD